jgi:glycosyltransferase involved in cell wall biosynthesis
MDSTLQDKKLSIILLGTQMTLGGAQKLLFEHAHWFLENGHSVTAVSFYNRDGLHQEWEKSYAVPVQSLSSFNKKAGLFHQAASLLTGIWNLWKILRAKKFDAIITFTHDSNILGAPLAWLAGVPVRIGTNLGEIRGMTKFREGVHTLLVNTRIIQTLVASSTRTRQNSIDKGVNPDQIKVVYNSISPFTLENINRNEVRGKLGLHEDEVFLLTIGRLVYEKGHEFLIEATGIAARSHPDIFTGICGGGPLRKQLMEQITALNLEEKVRLLGQWENINELLAAADIFVLPSRWEGLPMALLEAMMANLPVIATRVEGVEEVIEDGVHGLLVPLEDVNGLAKAILQLSTAPEQRRRMGAAARLRVLNSYTADQMCGQYLTIMLECLVKQGASK